MRRIRTNIRPMPSPLQAMQTKSLEELVRIKNGLPRRVAEANRILNPERRAKAIARLTGEATLIDTCLGPRLAAKKAS